MSDAALAAAKPDDSPPLYIWIGFIAMVVGQFMAILDIQIVASALGSIQAGVSASRDEISWVQTSYLIAEVIGIPLSGFLGRALGTRLLFCISALAFSFTSLLCAFASSRAKRGLSCCGRACRPASRWTHANERRRTRGR